MSYDPIIPNRLVDRKSPWPPALVDLIEKSILKLSASPQTLGRKAVCPPNPPVGYVYHERIEFEGRRFTVTVFFVYGPDVGQISVTGISLLPSYTEPVRE